MLTKVVRKISQRGVGPALNAVAYRAKLKYFNPNLTISRTSIPLITMGTNYGGWTFLDVPSLQGARVVSCGVGEDMSFDAELANTRGCRILLVDPTPRAIDHVNAVLARVGQAATTPLKPDAGAQDPASYDLSRVTPGQISLIDKALWTEPGTVKFFAPRNPAHVSHSIVDIQSTGGDGTVQLEVPSVTLQDICREHEISQIELLKMDIEGAEMKVIEAFLGQGIRPRQLLVEFERLVFPSAESTAAVKRMDAKLRDAGYLCFATNGLANFLYALAGDFAR